MTTLPTEHSRAVSLRTRGAQCSALPLKVTIGRGARRGVRTPSFVLTAPPLGLCWGAYTRFSLPLTEPGSLSEYSTASHLESAWKMAVGSQRRSHWSSCDAEPSSRRINLDSGTHRGNGGGTTPRARCPPTGWNSAASRLMRPIPGHADAPFQLPSAVQLVNVRVGRGSRRTPDEPGLAQELARHRGGRAMFTVHSVVEPADGRLRDAPLERSINQKVVADMKYGLGGRIRGKDEFRATSS